MLFVNKASACLDFADAVRQLLLCFCHVTTILGSLVLKASS
jgi:hypothetical protein